LTTSVIFLFLVARLVIKGYSDGEDERRWYILTTSVIFLISFDDFHVGIKGDRTGVKKACESRSGLFSVLIGERPRP
jgi:hypothetical protein